MGVVYKAEDTKLKRPVALKFLPLDLTRDDESKKRFIHEAQAASAIQHNNICTIHEIDETPDGQIFICMDYYKGETLKKKIERGPQPIDEAIDIALQIAQGLAKAHGKEIVHRDIKPANIMLTTDNVIKIVDFGLAKLAGRTKLTKDDSTLGTAAYMSPEQAQGAEVDHRSDIFSLGVVLYEMLTGQAPFKGDYEQAVVYSILHEDPEPLTGLRTGVPIELERFVNKCLAKEPAERYQHADELLVDLRQVEKELESGETSLRTGVSTRISERRTRSYALPGLLLAVLISALSIYFFFFRPEAVITERIPVAVADFINETSEDDLNGLSGMLITALEQSPRLSVLTRSRMFDTLKQLGKKDIARIDETLGREICKQANVGGLVIASIRKFDQLYAIDLKVIDPLQDKYLFAAGEKGEGKTSIPAMIDKLATRTRKGLKEKEDEIQATSRNVVDLTTPNLQAYQHYFKGKELLDRLRFQQAEGEFKKAIVLDSTFGLAYHGLARAISWRLGYEHLPKEPLKKALTFIDGIPEKEKYLIRAAGARLEKGLEEQLAILKEMERSYPNDKEMLFQIGDLSHHSGQYPTAVQYFEKVLRMDPFHRRAWYHFKDSYVNAYAQSENLDAGLNRLFKLRREFPNRPEIAATLADFYINQGNYQNAEAELTPLIEPHQPVESIQLGYAQLYHLYQYRGQYRAALQACDKLIEFYWQVKDSSEIDVWQIRKSLVLAKGRKDLGLAWQEAEKTFGFHDRVRSGLAEWYLTILKIYRGDYDASMSLAMPRMLSTAHQSLRAFVYSHENRCALAAAVVDSVLQKSHRGYEKIYVLYPLALCQFHAGQFDDAARSVIQLQSINDNRYGPRAWYYSKSIYLLGKIYESKGARDLALKNYAKFLEVWKDADHDLPELLDAKARLAKLKGMSKN